jgi:hypothetical protein
MNNVLAWQIDVCVKHRGNENGGETEEGGLVPAAAAAKGSKMIKQGK